MPAVQRDGDANAGGGIAQGGEPSVRINGRPAMTPGQSVTPHPPYPRKGRNEHNNGGQLTAGGSKTVKVGGKPAVLTGDVDTCGHPRVGGSDNVRVG
jgi:uncharacterized Zn-binding protein involved in type VI secretion